MTLFEAACELGARVGPVMPVKGKRPTWPDWPAKATRAPTPGPDWEQATGIGLLTGERAGYFVLDVDGERGLAALVALQTQHGAIPPTWTSCTGGGGRHYFFRWPGFLVRGSAGKLAPGLDIRGEGGQVVAPPSAHPSGTSYSWAQGAAPWECELAIAPAWLLDELKPKLTAVPSPQAPTQSDVLRRASKYLAKIPGAVEHSGGHDQAWLAALAVVRGFALSESDAFALLSADYNPRCAPPWSEKELRHKVKQASQSASVAWGYLRDAPKPGKSSTPATSSGPAAAREEPGCDDGDEAQLPGRPVADLLAAHIPLPQWLVTNYVQEHSIVVLAGPPGSGKTLLSFDWAAQCVAAGRKVFIGENEGGLHSLQKRLRRACAAAGIRQLPESFRYELNMDLSLSNVTQVREFANSLTGYDFILLDSLASFYPGLKENDPEHMGQVAEALKILCAASGAAVQALHHTTKSSWKPGERPSLADLRGHSTLHGRIDTGLVVVPLERVPDEVRFELWVVKQREEDPGAPRQASVLMKGTEAKVEWTDLENTAGPTSRVLALLDPILAAVPFEGAGTGMLKSHILEAVKGRSEDKYAAFEELIQTKKLKRAGNLIFRPKYSEKPSDSAPSRTSRDPRDPEREDEKDES